ncbi:PREDICTED: serine protease nudel [Dinoponera quadriceps]|uniref:limulus clotting factor C n=1 Tax=Dinoponera quadriceps TaxID=609295 RepID=A0A6P3XBH8_DINQU|nr:PREDICTED: serine protease nudel [Dinoponera quadriceps]
MIASHSVYLESNSDKVGIEKISQVAEQPRIDQSCCIVLSDLKNTESDKSNAKSANARDCSNFCGRYKRILLIGAALLIAWDLMRIMLAVTLLLSDVQDTSDRVRQGYFFGKTSLSEVTIDGKSSDWAKLASGGTRSTKETRSKREISRNEQGMCDVSAERCEVLLRSMHKYLETLKSDFSDKGSDVTVFEDILKCLYCRKASKLVTNEKYLPYDHISHSQDSSAVTGFFANTEAEEDVRGSADRPEKMNLTVASLDRTSSDGASLITYEINDINGTDKQPNGSIDSHVAKIQSDVSIMSEEVDNRAAKISRSNAASSNDATEGSATTASWVKTKEKSTDVTGIDGGPAHPSFEGRPENRSTTAAIDSARIQDDRFAKGNAERRTGKNAEGAQRMTSTTWPHLVCFYPVFNKQLGSTFYPGSSDFSSSQNHEFGQSFFPLGFYSPISNNEQARAQPTGVGPTVTLPPMFSLNQQQPTWFSERYFCTYISVPTFPQTPNTLSHFVRSSSGEVKEPSESYSPEHFGVCPLNSHRCAGTGRCILKVKWCDGRADCSDASDETMCSCRDRISRDRLCDGYFDCPHGEDELGCFNCPDDSFSCDDWDRRHNSDNCVPLSQRCDGMEQCQNGKDELDCNILSTSYIDRKDIFTIGYTEGYLHKNVRGRWYPVCSSEPSWAMDACASETGQPATETPKIEMVRPFANDFPGPYLNRSDGQMQLVHSCSDLAVFVKCPPLLCGTRVSQNSLLASTTPSDTTESSYVRRAESDLEEVYLETLKLLDEKYSDVERSKEDGNVDTLVEPQVGVVGGRASQPKAWPFLVAIYKDGDFHCGGVILTEVWILTAAHCMAQYEKHYYEVQAGTLRRFSFSPMAQSRKARSVLIHADFNGNNMQNDIALIMLDERLLFNRWVRQACLPAEWQPTPRSMCVAIGWGATREFGPDLDQLREVEVPILSSCKHTLDRNNATICAGYPYGGYDACQGDSGGPLMCRDPNSQWYVAGVISHGDGCARPDEPGVYTKVSYFLRWIQKQTEESPMLSNQSTPLAKCPGFSCQGKLEKCLPIEKRCDRIVDCLDAEDEVDCVWQMMDSNGRSDGSNEFVEMGERSAGQRTNGTYQRISSQMFARNISATNRAAETTTSKSSNGEEIVRTDEPNEVSSTAGATMTTISSVRSTFTCTSLIQTITIGKRCDKRLDCEDGTDEEGCTCKDYLSNLRATAICDGHLDCDDETDEKNCGMCKEDEFRCGRSGVCIPMTRRCDRKFDCALKEDEIDCFVLTNGEYVEVDSDDRPALNVRGLLARYTNGTWRTECPQSAIRDNDTLTTRIGEKVCRYLGFRSVQSVERVNVNRTKLEVQGRSNNASTDYKTGDGPCSALRIHCRPVLSGSVDSHLIADPDTGSQTYLWPWLAAILVDGRYRCPALLLKPDWLLSNSGCTRDIRLSVNYTTTLVGYSRSYLHVDGPYQQISVVDDIKEVKLSDVSLLHLKTPVKLTRYVLPLFLQEKIYPPGNNDSCVAVGTDEEYATQSVFLQPILEDCDKCHRCFVEATRSECSNNKTRSDWTGTVVCHGQEGWYPAAVFHEKNGPCSFQNTRNLTSIDYVHAYITQILGRLHGKPQSTEAEATCDGIRCNIGWCVSWDRVCDGVADCRDAVDEMDEMCDKAQRVYNNDIDRKCAKTRLRCGNGECMPKNTFCDGKVDCSDGTDEPISCTCAEYLKLTAPERLCDGVRHCLDKTDESPDVCRCTETSFKCDIEGNSTCIPQDFVCDGDQDCPNGRDEKQCRKLRESTADKPGTGEVMQRSYGVWHSQCFPVVVTSAEANTACREIGYTNGTIDREDRAWNEPVVPSRDDFYTIRVNLETWVTMRDDKPLIDLVRPEDPCYRLFVKCA